MTSHCRSCHLSIPNPHVDLPNPERLAVLAPHIGILVDAAAEFESFTEDGYLGTPLEFLRWLEVDVRRAAGLRLGRAVGE